MNADPLAHKVPHSDSDIRLQKILAVALPIAAALMLAWALYNSRGEYRLTGNILSTPGHPNVPLEDMIAVDKARWDRKGIAYIAYKNSASKGRIRLDDFIYDRDPTDEIYKRIEAHMGGGQTVETPEA